MNEAFEDLDALGAPSASLPSYTSLFDFRKQERSASPLTSKVLEIDWRKFFPLEIDARESVRIIEYSETREFFLKNFKPIYGTAVDGERFLAEEFHEAKRRYYELAGDFFGFFSGSKLVGVFTGTLNDWGSYYFRNCSLLREFQGEGRYQKLLKHLIEALEESGIERIEGDVAPSNLAHIHILNKLQFNVTGLTMSERWGALLRFTRFTSRKHEQVFLDQFCFGPKPQLSRGSK